MKIIVVHNEIQYISKDLPEIDYEMFINMYDEINSLVKFKMDLESGGKAMFGKDVLAQSIILFVPNSDEKKTES